MTKQFEMPETLPEVREAYRRRPPAAAAADGAKIFYKGRQMTRGIVRLTIPGASPVTHYRGSRFVYDGLTCAVFEPGYGYVWARRATLADRLRWQWRASPTRRLWYRLAMWWAA